MKQTAEAPASPVFGIPRVPRTVVSRPRLSALIADLLTNHDLIVIRAPSGAGKTVALAGWAASGITPGYISWVTLDERYADRVSFWREMILGTAPRVDESQRPLINECADALLAGADIRAVLRRFVPFIPQTTIVIDRLDLVEDEGLIEDMIWALQRCHQLQAVVTTRTRSLMEAPAVSLALDMAVIGAVPLQLSIEETRQLLKLRGFTMDPVALHSAAGGHPLLTRAIKAVYGKSGRGSISASVQTAVSDFLNLSLSKSSIGPETKDFMVRTSIPESFTLDLASQLSGADNVTAILDDLEDQGLGLWFKYKETLRFQYTAAVRILLQKSLKTIEHHEIDRLTRIVIDDDLAVGNVGSALRQATVMGDLDLASRIACDHHLTLLVSQAQVVLDILESLPLTRLRKHPALIMALALCHNGMPGGGIKAVEYFGLAVVFAGMYKSSMEPGQRMWMLTVESTALRFAGKLEPAMKYAKRAVESFEESPMELQEQLTALESSLYTQSAIAYIHDQQFETAAKLLIKALEASRRSDSVAAIFLSTGLLAFALTMSGRSAEARTHLGWLNDARWPPGMLDGYWATTYRMAQVREAMDRQSYPEASGYLDLINDEMQVSEFWPYIVTFKALQDLQRTGVSGGPATLEARIRQAHRAPLNSSGEVELDCLRATINLIAGQPVKAAAVVSKYSRPAPRVLIIRARTALYLGDPGRTMRLTGRPENCLDPRLEVHRLLLRAAALQRIGDTEAARDNAQAAGSLMVEYGLTMTSALLPQEDLPALTRYVQTEEPSIPDPVEIMPTKTEAASLTPRELVVLNAFTETSSATEVARILNVSVNTVKSQRRSIHKKLGAKTREEALLIARLQRLLED